MKIPSMCKAIKEIKYTMESGKVVMIQKGDKFEIFDSDLDLYYLHNKKSANPEVLNKYFTFEQAHFSENFE